MAKKHYYEKVGFYHKYDSCYICPIAIITLMESFQFLFRYLCLDLFRKYSQWLRLRYRSSNQFLEEKICICTAT